MILSTSWGGDLDNFVRQSSQRGLTRAAPSCCRSVESSLQRLGKDLPAGVIVGARGDHYFLHPERKNDADFKDLVKRFKDKTGDYPIYPVFHMSQALAALEAAYEKAMAANGGEWPDREQVVDAMAGISFKGLGRTVTIRADNQGLEDQLLGTTVHDDAYGFAVLDNMMIFPADKVTTPVGQISTEWLKTLTPAILDIEADSYSH